MTELRALVVVERDDADLRGVADAVQRALGAPPEAPEPVEPPRSPIALPVGAGEPPARLRDAEVAVVLDEVADELAREAGVPSRVVLFPRYGVAWDGPLDAQLVLVAHEALIDDAVRAGASRRRVRVVGPVAMEGWSPEGRDQARASLDLVEGARCVVVRAGALDLDELAPILVQLSLVRGHVAWLFDVGADVDRARALRRRVPGYDLDARMFADGPESLTAYRAADAVLGRVEGPEAIRALATGASFVALAPRAEQLALAHALERARRAAFVDALPTLAVALDAALRPEALQRARAVAAEADLGRGAERVAEVVRELARGELGAPPPSGLPVGLERLDARDEPRRPEPPPRTDLDRSVDAELAALRAKLGLAPK